jgi:hypothetical protein
MQQQQLRSLSIPSGGREVGRVIYALHAAAEIVILSLSLSVLLAAWPSYSYSHSCMQPCTYFYGPFGNVISTT